MAATATAATAATATTPPPTTTTAATAKMAAKFEAEKQADARVADAKKVLL